MADMTREQKLAAAVIRFGEHCAERGFTLPLWAVILWDEAIDLAREVEREKPWR